MTMCLELLNQLVGSGFAWLGLTVFSLLLAALASARLPGALKPDPNKRQSPGFTCPCYAPPGASPRENRQ
jgi:hypothetical protein